MKQAALALWVALSLASLALLGAGCGDNLDADAEDCERRGDEDGNGQADCDDPACFASCPASCGNSKVEMNEGCDDGNATDGDGCDANCTPTGCGNGVKTMNEGCDDGNLVDDDGCDSNCALTGCGNGARTPTENCDDGNTDSGDGCDANCTLTACGNDVLTMGEVCDDGDLVSGDGCDANCTITACGNGLITPSTGETCDDGNRASGDGCDENCTMTACGNGIITMNTGETCDDGGREDDDGCDSNCTITACGNGIRTSGEECDDGNPINGDGCDVNCTESRCGNGAESPSEECDDGNPVNGDGCDINCTESRCGNDIEAPNEECDDGNTTDDDGCDSNCTETRCGNGVPTSGEECDDGNTTNGDDCDINCTTSRCGNNIEAPNEECDDGNTTDDDGCDSNCTETRCGNGVPTSGEVCDDGNTTNGDGCDTNCTISACGNGITAPDEGCDDTNVVDLDGCSSLCQPEPFEIEPNEDGSISTGAIGNTGNDFAIANADANGAYTRSINIRAALTPAGDEDVFKFTNPGPGRVAVKFDTWNMANGLGAPCPNAGGVDTGLLIKDATGAVLAIGGDRNGNADRCSSAITGLGPGESVYVQIVEFGDNLAIPGYALQADYVPIICGDGVMGLGETCDDGNTTGGDGCSATCTLETPLEAEPNDTFAEAATNPVQISGDVTLRGALTPVADIDMYQVTVATPTVVRFETLSAFFDCTFSTELTTDLRLYDSAGTELVADTASAGISACSAIVMFLAAGTYYVRVEERGNNEVLANYFLQVDYQADRGAEAEPPAAVGQNDDIASAEPNLEGGTNVYVFGDHMTVGDVDFYAITVPPLARIRAEVIEGDRAVESCESGGIDSLLRLFDPSGAPIAIDDDAGRSHCSLIDGGGTTPFHPNARNPTLSPRTYYLSVGNPATGLPGERQFVYRLSVTLR